MKEFKVEFIRHPSAKSVVIAYFRNDYPKMKIKNLLKQKTEFKLIIENTPVYPGTVKELIIVVTNLGYWGFCDTLKHTTGKRWANIHYWITKKKRVLKEDLMELFAHELGHAIGYNSEWMAARFGTVASLAYVVMKSSKMKEVKCVIKK